MRPIYFVVALCALSSYSMAFSNTPEKISRVLDVELNRHYEMSYSNCGRYMKDFFVNDVSISGFTYTPQVDKFQGHLNRNFGRGYDCKWSRTRKVRTTRNSVEVRIVTTGCKMDGVDFRKITNLGNNRYEIESNIKPYALTGYPGEMNCEFEIMK